MCEITQRWSIKPSSAPAHVGIPHQPTCFLSQPGWLSDCSLPGAVLLLFPRGVLQSFLIPLSSVVVMPLVCWVCGMVLLKNQLPKCCGSCWLPPQGTTPLWWATESCCLAVTWYSLILPFWLAKAKESSSEKEEVIYVILSTHLNLKQKHLYLKKFKSSKRKAWWTTLIHRAIPFVWKLSSLFQGHFAMFSLHVQCLTGDLASCCELLTLT